MGKTYSLDLRESAVAAVIAAAQPQAVVASHFGIGLATLWRWIALWRAGESLAPKAPRPGPTGFFAEAATRAALEAQVAAAPDDRLDDHCRAWQAATGQQVSRATMGRAIARLEWTRKKSIC